MISLEDLPADTTIMMTDELIRLFRFAKCEPTCHACEKALPVGVEFRLMTAPARPLRPSIILPSGRRTEQEFIDEMVCSTCGLTELDAMYERKEAARIAALPSTRKGYSRPHRPL